jgi:hypothetical protein
MCANTYRITVKRQENFWERVQKTPTCWLWTAGTDKDGYGKLRRTKAHRIAWEMQYGPIPEGLMVCHHCDNPRCVRHDHLFLGTNSDNQRDAIQKGRKVILRGEACSWARLQSTDIVPIFELAIQGISQRVIAQAYGVSQTSISDVLRRKRWLNLSIPQHILDAYARIACTRAQEVS